MALLIDTSVYILGYTTIPGLYIRMFYSSALPGNKIHVSVQKYMNKLSYSDNIINYLPVDGIPEQFEFSYDRSIDGIDTLGFAHKKVKEYLSTDITQEVARTDASTGLVIMDPSTMDPILDSSTGDPIIDSSTGEIILDITTGTPIYDAVVIQNKFADASDILFVDVDPSII